MTRLEFENHKDPLTMIISLNPENGNVLYDTYDWVIADSFVKDFEKDFPNHITMIKQNKAVVNARRKSFGMKPKEAVNDTE